MAPSTVTSPIRFSQAVSQPQPRPPSTLPQWYSPPAVGYALAICAMPSANSRETRQPIGQPIPMLAPPMLLIPWPSELIPPERMQMIENEMAKLEDPFMRRSSCLYPIEASSFSSSVWPAIVVLSVSRLKSSTS